MSEVPLFLANAWAMVYGAVILGIWCLVQGVDTGIGISMTDLERIFEPFEQVDSTTTRPYGGIGLGLAVCRDLTRLLGGNLTAESFPGVGSTFRLDLPRAV